MLIHESVDSSSGQIHLIGEKGPAVVGTLSGSVLIIALGIRRPSPALEWKREASEAGSFLLHLKGEQTEKGTDSYPGWKNEMCLPSIWEHNSDNERGMGNLKAQETITMALKFSSPCETLANRLQLSPTTSKLKSNSCTSPLSSFHLSRPAS